MRSFIGHDIFIISKEQKLAAVMTQLRQIVNDTVLDLSPLGGKYFPFPLGYTAKCGVMFQHSTRNECLNTGSLRLPWYMWANLKINKNDQECPSKLSPISSYHIGKSNCMCKFYYMHLFIHSLMSYYILYVSITNYLYFSFRYLNK